MANLDEQLKLAAEPQDTSIMEKMLAEAEGPEDDIQDEPNKKAEEVVDGRGAGSGDSKPSGNDDPVDPEDGNGDAVSKPDDNDPKSDSGDDKGQKGVPGEDGDTSGESKGAAGAADKFNEEIDQIQLKTGASTKSQEALRVLKDKAKAEHIRAIEADKEKLEAQNKLKEKESQALPEEVGKELNELRSFKRAFDLENDPEFNDKYVKAITAEEEGAIDLLKSWKLPDSAAKYISENGGIAKFRLSNDLMPEDPRFRNEDGTRMSHSDWYDQFVEQRLTRAQKEELGDRLSTIRQKARERDSAIKDAAANRSNLIKERQGQAEKQAKEWNDRVVAHAPKALANFGEAAKLMDIPKDATDEQKKDIEAHNARFHKAQKIAEKYVSHVTPENLTEAAIGAAYAEIAKETMAEQKSKLEQSDQRIKELEEELTKIKSAGKTSHRNSAPLTHTKDVAPTRSGDDEGAMAALLNTV